jgi:long-chain fatty acid transport protein
VNIRFVTASLLMASVVEAAGFRLNETGARASGMGNAVTALSDDATALYFNPAAIAGHKGVDASVGVALIIPSLSFKRDTSGQTTSIRSNLSTPFNAFLTYGLNEQFSLGLGLFNPYGASAQWPDGWEGAGRALNSSVQTFALNPTMSFAFHPRFKVGGGIQIMRGTVLIERGLDFVDSSGKVSLGAGAWGLGFNAAMQIELIERTLFLGATYRSQVDLDFSGRAAFSNVPNSFRSLLSDQKVTSQISLPQSASFGLGYKATERLRLGLDVNLTAWDSFQALTISFENPALTNPLSKKWMTVASLHVGGEYDLSDAFKGRLGFVYDPATTIRSTLTPDLPDATRYRFSAGAGWRSSSGFGVDLSYQFILLAASQSTAPGFAGTYTGSAHIVSLNVGFRQ